MNIIQLLGKLDEISVFRRKIIRTLNTGSLNLSINLTQERVLMALLKTRENNMTDLSFQVGLEKSSLTRVIDSLVEEGYVDRSFSAQDRRIINCILTEKGMDIANRIDNLMKEHFDAIISELSAGEKEELYQCLCRSVDLLAKCNKGGTNFDNK